MSVINSMLLFMYFIFLLLFHMLVFSTQLDRNLLQEKRKKKSLVLVYRAGMHPHSIPLLFFFSSNAHTHTPTHTSSNMSTFPSLVQKKQVYMTIQVQ